MDKLSDFLKNCEELQIKLCQPGTLLYKYVDFNTALEIINHGTLKFTAPSEFNDSFDAIDDLIDFDVNEEEAKKYMNEYVAPFLKKPVKFLNTDITWVQNSAKRQVSSIRNEIGILCMSTTKDDIKLWSLYAERHHGLVFGFNFSDYLSIDPDSPFLGFLHVIYKDDFKKYNFFRERRKALTNMLYTKSKKHWEYEDEVRSFMLNNRLENFQPNMLYQVIFGSKVSEEKQLEIISLVKSKKYSSKFFKAVPSSSNYSISIQEL